MELTLPTEGFARPKQVAHALGVSRTMIYKMINDGKFPKPHKDGKMSFWPVEEVRNVIIERRNRAQSAIDPNNQPTLAS